MPKAPLPPALKGQAEHLHPDQHRKAAQAWGGGRAGGGPGPGGQQVSCEEQTLGHCVHDNLIAALGLGSPSQDL